MENGEKYRDGQPVGSCNAKYNSIVGSVVS